MLAGYARSRRRRPGYTGSRDGVHRGAMKRVAVYCGSSTGHDGRYARAAALLGDILVRRGVGLVYGGGRVGLMGILADAVLAAGGEVRGVIPKALATKELAHASLTELFVVGSMHER